MVIQSRVSWVSFRRKPATVPAHTDPLHGRRTAWQKVEKNRGSSDKRERILEGALEAFAEKGFYNTKVSEIAGKAGVADGTIYLYFKNKDDLLISLFEDRMDWIIERFETDLASMDGGVLDKIRHVVRMHFGLASRIPTSRSLLPSSFARARSLSKSTRIPNLQII